MAANALKTNDPAKCLISRPNDFKDLRQASRNRWFRLAKDLFRFCWFWPPRSAKRNGRGLRPAAPMPGEASSPRARQQDAAIESPIGASPSPPPVPGSPRRQGPPTPSPACRTKQKKLRKRAAKALKSLARVTLCALLTGSPCRPRSACSRSYRSGSAARPAQTACRPALWPSRMATGVRSIRWVADQTYPSRCFKKAMARVHAISAAWRSCTAMRCSLTKAWSAS